MVVSRPLTVCKGRVDPWLGRIPKFIPVTENMSNHTLGSILCASSGYTCVCGYKGEPWAYEYLEAGI